MTNNTNIYDIDGNLLRAASDTHEITAEEAKAKIEEYQEKLKQLSNDKENAHKIGVYNTYIRNLQMHMFRYYLAHPEFIPRHTTEDQIKKAMTELQAEVEKDEMDEYIEPIEEIKDEQ